MTVHDWLALDLVQRQEALDAMPAEERSRIRAAASEINRIRESEALSKQNALTRQWQVWTDRWGVALERAAVVLFILLACFGVYRWCVWLYESGAHDMSRYGSPDRPAATESYHLRPLTGNVFPGTRVYDQSGNYRGTIISVNPKKGDRSFIIANPDGTLDEKNWDAALHFGWQVK